jgi:hypothetical protein
MVKITYYDFSDLVYSSFFLYGFFRFLERSGSFQFEVSKEVPDLAVPAIIDQDNRNILFSMLLFKVASPDGEYYFCIDTRDSNDPADPQGLGYHIPLLEKVRYYFKANFNREIATASEVLAPYLDRIHPIAPFFPVALPEWYRLLPRVRPAPEMGWNAWCVRHRLKRMVFLVGLDALRGYRNTAKDLDLFYVAYHHGRVAEREEDERLDEYLEVNDFRFQLIHEIRRRDNLTSIAGFVSEGVMPRHYERFRLRSRSYRLREYLHEVSRAKVAIYVRGVHDCLSFKLGQLLCMGMPISGQRLANNADWLYSLNHFRGQFAYESPKELIDRAEAMLGDKRQLADIAESNAAIFERYFSPEKVVSGILNRLGVS